MKSGFILTAVCSDCHTAHCVLPANKLKSFFSKKNVSNTCGKCHCEVE